VSELGGLISTTPLSAVAPSITAATITAVASLLVALFSVVRIRKFEKEQAEDNAKIAYAYEARKRLYTVCEPLLFQAMEQAAEARARIHGLARCSRERQLRRDGSGWLALGQVEEYYFESTVYSLLAPVTAFSILQRGLTTIDLTLDDKVREQYELLKLIFFSFSKDWDLAAGGGAASELPYDRNKSDPGEPRREELLVAAPERYAPQGLYRGMIYLVAEAFVPRVGDVDDGLDPRTARCMTFGEFEREWRKARSERRSARRRAFQQLRRPVHRPSAMSRISDRTVELFEGFHPARKPVLWRLLVAQHLLYKVLLEGKPELGPLAEHEVEALDWRTDGQDPADFRETLGIAESFVGRELEKLRARLDQRIVD